MNVPTCVEVNGELWTVDLRPRVLYRGKQVGGLTIPSRHEILIAKNISGRRQVEVMIHEPLHAALPDLDEDAIIRAEEAVADMLTRAELLPRRIARVTQQ